MDRVEKLQNILNKKEEEVRNFLLPNELEEYNKLEAREKEKGKLFILYPDDYKKLLFYRLLGNGLNRGLAKETSDLQVKTDTLGYINTSKEEKERLRYLRFCKSLIETKQNFTEDDANEFYSLQIKEETEGKLSDQESVKLLFYRLITDYEKNLTKEEATEYAKLEIMQKYNLLSDSENDRLIALRNK